MDTFAHGVLGVLAASRSGLPGVGLAARPVWYRDWTLYAALFFGMLPDLASFGVYMAGRFFSGGAVLAKPELEDLPRYVFVNYSIFHSLLIAAAVWLVIFMVFRPLALPCFAWMLHIVCDIPVHGKEYFATPLFWPLSDWRFDGWSFGTYLWIVPVYWGLIALLFVLRAVLISGNKKKMISSGGPGKEPPPEQEGF